MKRVVIESPYAGDIETNTAYARRCFRHSLDLGEAPLASHLLYPQVLDELKTEDRRLGILCGIKWLEQADFQVFYTDLGWSLGMRAALDAGRQMGIFQRFRALDGVPTIPEETNYEIYRV